MKKRFLLGLGLLFITQVWIFAADDSQQIIGVWAGELKVPGTTLKVVVKIDQGKGGELSGGLDSPDQGAFDIPISEIILEGKTLSFKVPAVNGEYKGEISPDYKSIDGFWMQGGGKFPLLLKKTNESPKRKKRPQEPEKPYPYIEEEIQYTNKKDGTRLAGTLTLPPAGRPFGAVILITGSGSQDRDETVDGHKPFLILADFITRAGIAVLRMDDRGVGGSTGKVSQSTTRDFAYDVLAGVEFLKSHPKIHPDKIGLIGHSEGGIIAPMAASMSKDVAFIVLMAGTGMTGEEIIDLQSRLIGKADGIPEEKTEEELRQQKIAFEIVKKYPDNKTAEIKLKELFKKEFANKKENVKESQEPNDQQIAGQLEQILNPWFRFFLTYDPKEALRKVTCPVLAINGEKDLQVPPKESLAAIKRALDEGGNKAVTVKELPGLNHLFQTAKTGSPKEYAQISETISPQALNIIADWVKKQIDGLK